MPENVEFSEFLAPNVTGLGYLNALTDETILQLTDPEDSDGDGISGVVNLIDAPDWLNPDSRYHQLQASGKYIGRFGRKGGAIDLLHQTVNAYKEDMGITSDFDKEDPINFQSSSFSNDGIANPEISGEIVQQVVFYIQTLKAPPRRSQNDTNVFEGEKLFKQIGCVACHKETFKTGPSEIESLNNKSFTLFRPIIP